MFNIKEKLRKNLLMLLFVDLVLFAFAYACAYLLRFDLNIPYSHYLNFRKTLIPILLFKILAFNLHVSTKISETEELNLLDVDMPQYSQNIQ